MSEFMPTPTIVLHGKQELLDALNNPYWDQEKDDSMLRWKIKSDFIIECIQEIQNSGKYAYNADVNRLVSEKLKLPEHDYNSSNTPLSTLVYNAQCYKRSDDLYNRGYVPLTQSMVNQAYDQKSKIEFLGDTGYFGTSCNTYNTRKIGDKIYLMKPRVRKWYVRIEGQPARIV